MKTATIREAQHNLSRLVNEVQESGQEIVLTRRGEEVGKLVPISPPENPLERKIDWAAWTKERRKFLESMPMTEGSAMDAEREGYRW